jgi:uncharacterized metal-binding protein
MVLTMNKVGIVSCSGEDMPGGTITRVATRLVLGELRPDRAVTICLPLFLVGNSNERDFAKVHPTITVDGCEKRCAQIATTNLSAKPAYAILVPDIAKDFPGVELRPCGKLSADEMKIARRVAEEIAARVDAILGIPPAMKPGDKAGER